MKNRGLVCGKDLDLAGFLFDSLRTKIMPLADEVIVYPGHGAGSACGKKMSKETQGTLGDQKILNYALRADMSRNRSVVAASILKARGFGSNLLDGFNVLKNMDLPKSEYLEQITEL